MAREEAGAANPERQPLLLLSGLICDETIWAEIVPRLAAIADLRIYSFPGFDSIETMARHVLATAPPHFALAGHSMGGRVALEILRAEPARVRRLALLNTGARAAEESEARTRRRLVAIAREQGMTALAAQWLPPMMAAPQARVDAVTPRLTRMAERATPESFAAQVKALLERPDHLEMLPTIRVPTLLLSGAEDNWSPLAQHAEMHERIPRSTLVAIPEAGHMAPVEQPAAVAAALEAWLAA
ncbi:MAG TPA: alpha/beta fold hydrolase [Steroidobacteraceae bacterium]|nr:alpha/beta fold hydrolase [Steroidobacteraceae bacterium]